MCRQTPAPLVSVVTPVYNGGRYLAECIESVLSQRYGNWEYTIINNCSTDNTLDIVESYRKKDHRIRVINNHHFVGVIENHNIAFSSISADSEYCKVVSADDWLYPDCIETMVRLAEDNPAVGIVQAYVVNFAGVRWPGLAVNKSIFRGYEIGRLYLLGKIDFCGIPSSSLYRSSLIRSVNPFFPGKSLASDAAANLICLQRCDFGMVHQILSFERVHDGSLTTASVKLNSYLLDRMELVMHYGPMYLTQHEITSRLDEMRRDYYEVLGIATVNGGLGLWTYHRGKLAELGLPFDWGMLSRAILFKLLDLALNPKQTAEKALRRVRRSQWLGLGVRGGSKADVVLSQGLQVQRGSSEVDNATSKYHF